MTIRLDPADVTTDSADNGVIQLQTAASYLQSRLALKPGRIVSLRWEGPREFTVESEPPKRRRRGPNFRTKVVRVSSPDWDKQPRYRGMLLKGEAIADGIGFYVYSVNGKFPNDYFWLMESDLDNGDSARNFAQRIERYLTDWPR